jgi:Bacteriorhodopsin-like protein.
MAKVVKNTLHFSLIAQFIALLIGLYAYSLEIPPNDFPLKTILVMENIVQAIEFTFYVWFGIFAIQTVMKSDIAKYRYYDWMFTTPIMLVNTLLYLKYVNYHENSRKGELTDSWNFIAPEWANILQIVIANGLMLIVGYLQEIGKMSLLWSSLIGFFSLYYTFWILYTYVSTNATWWLWLTIFSLWNLYGVAALFPSVWKNAGYNILDIFSKNVYGVYISIVVIMLNRAMIKGINH